MQGRALVSFAAKATAYGVIDVQWLCAWFLMMLTSTTEHHLLDDCMVCFPFKRRNDWPVAVISWL